MNWTKTQQLTSNPQPGKPLYNTYTLKLGRKKLATIVTEQQQENEVPPFGRTQFVAQGICWDVPADTLEECKRLAELEATKDF